jgi:cysteinyl-tRNA synthetase
MEDDFNTADAIATLFELVRDINTVIASAADCPVSAADLSALRDLFDEINGVLGIVYAAEDAIPAAVTELVEKRAAAKKAKDFTLADSIREEVAALGYVIEETRQGVNVKRRVCSL